MEDINDSKAASEDKPRVSHVIDITVKTIDSKNFQFQVESEMQIKAFKEKVSSQVGIEPENQRMIFCGRVLSDDKNFKDYNIDNGKVIHLVKRAPPPQQRNNTNSNNNASNQQNDQNRSRRFHSYRSEDGHFLMGTISLDSPSNLLNQMVQQLFSANHNSSSNTGNSTNPNSQSSQSATAAGGVDSSVRDRFNHIRRILGYINTNFQILENPHRFPHSTSHTDISSDQLITHREYSSLFNEVFSVYESLRPRMNRYFADLQENSPTEEQRAEAQNTHSILMRISHHLSHAMHLLTDFNINYSQENMPVTLNTLDSIAASRSNTNINNSSSTNVSNTESTARIEFSTSTTSTSTMPRFTSQSFLPSPMVIMEVDTNINLPRNLMSGLRGFNFSFPENSTNFNSSQNSVNQTSSVTDSSASVLNEPQTSTANTSSTLTTSSTCPTTTPVVSQGNQNNNASSNDFSSSSTASDSNEAPNENENANNVSTATCSANSVPLAMTFDPFLNCDSTYTIPEVRSAANINSVSLMHQVVSSLADMADDSNSSETRNSLGNPLFLNINDLFQNISNSDSQSSDEMEFSELLRFIVRQIGDLNNDNFSAELNGSPRISDYLRSLNLFNNAGDEQSIISELLSVLFQNMGFEDLLSIIHSDFRQFNRLRRPFQDFIQNHLLRSGEMTIDNIRNEISTFVSSSNNSFTTITTNITPVQGVDSAQSFQNFIKETFAKFIYMVMQTDSDENFQNDLLAALKYLASSYINFCKVCFTDSNTAISQLITNYFELYGNYLNSRIRSYMTNVIIDRINSYSSSLDNDQFIIDQVQQYLVYTESGIPATFMQVEVTEPDRQSISNDSEVEFSDAISDFPSSSSTQKVPVDGGEQNWQTIVPNEWVPIISEDISKQKSIDQAHQPPFSDAYLNGMPKKRRLEHKPEDVDDNVDPKF